MTSRRDVAVIEAPGARRETSRYARARPRLRARVRFAFDDHVEGVPGMIRQQASRPSFEAYRDEVRENVAPRRTGATLGEVAERVEHFRRHISRAEQAKGERAVLNDRVLDVVPTERSARTTPRPEALVDDAPSASELRSASRRVTSRPPANFGLGFVDGVALGGERIRRQALGEPPSSRDLVKRATS